MALAVVALPAHGATPVAPKSASGAPAADSRAQHIVLVTIDGARAGIDVWPETMPTLARLAREGMRFRFATTPTPQTLPATASLLSGREPAAHGVRDDAPPRPGTQVPWLAVKLAAAGWTTAAFPADRFVHTGSPLAAGFANFDALAPMRPDSQRVDSALASLAGRDRRFVWLGFSFGQPMESWRRPRGAGFTDSAAYAVRAAAIDSALARLAAGIDRAGGDGSTLLAIAGTHGEVVPGWPLGASGFHEDPLPGLVDLSEDVLRVPLVLHGWRGRGAFVRDDDWTSTLDLAPTLAGAAGLAWSGDGQTLWSRSGAVAAPRTLVHELDLTRALEWAPRVAVRSGGIKRVARGSTRATLHADRGTAPTAAAAPARLETRLDARAATLAAERDSAAVARTMLPVDDEEQAWRDLLVRTLPRGKAPDSAAIQGLVALRLRCPAPLVLIEEALARSLAGEDDLAASIFVALRNRHPDLHGVAIAHADHVRRWRHLELVPVVLGGVPDDAPEAADARWREAFALALRLEGDGLAAFRDAAAVGAPPDVSWWEASRDYSDLMLDKAAAEAAPDSMSRLLRYARGLANFGLYDQAYVQLHRGRTLNPKDPAPNYWMGEVLIQQGRPENAANALARALEQDPNYVPALRAMAVALVLQDKKAKALPYVRKAVELDPGDPPTRYNLACLLSVTGDVGGAARELERALTDGYDDWERVRTDPDLDALRASEAGKRLLELEPAARTSMPSSR